MREKTSCSDNGDYPQFCESAASNEEVFRNFRRHPTYIKIVETLMKEWGQQYIDIAIKRTPILREYLYKFQSSETIGNPKLHNFKIPRKIPFLYSNFKAAPTTLRYIKVLSDLINQFGSLDELSIIEIGGGYGGQCKIIHDVFNFKKYTIYDLPGPLALTDKYLNSLGVKNYVLKTIENIDAKNADIIISNYAFSELNGHLQKVYFDNVISKSKHGYLTCNFKTHTFDKEQYDKNQLLKELNEINKNAKSISSNSILPLIDREYGIELIVF